jgi:CheY-like chemotaxis protein
MEPAVEDQTKILIVDDEPFNVDYLEQELEDLGHETLSVSNGAEALKLIDSDAPDLVLLDIMMPEIDGFQVLEQIKSREATRDIPVIMISALDDMPSVVKCIELGAEDYLTKPFDPVLLKSRIGASLEKKFYLQQIQQERARSDELLHAILPMRIAQELKETHKVRPRRYENVAVLFCDIVGFTPYCESHEPEEVVANLSEMIETFEQITLSHGLEKINSFADEFMAAGGIGDESQDPVMDCVQCGQEMIAVMHRLDAPWQVRVGIHVGPVLAGIVGKRKFLFGLWGDTVNTAARVQSHGVVGTVNISKEAWERVMDRCQGKSQGTIALKGKGPMELYRVDAVKA